VTKCHNCGRNMGDGEFKDHSDSRPRYHRNLWECIESMKADLKAIGERLDGMVKSGHLTVEEAYDILGKELKDGKGKSRR